MQRPGNYGQFSKMAKITKVPQPRTCRTGEQRTRNDSRFRLASSYLLSSDIISEQIAAYRIEKYANTGKLWPILQNGQNHKSTTAAYLCKMSKNYPKRQLFFSRLFLYILFRYPFWTNSRLPYWKRCKDLEIMVNSPKWPKSQKFASRVPVGNVKKWPKTTTFFFSLILIYFV